MIPNTMPTIPISTEPASKAWKIDFEQGRVVGWTDERDAVLQAAYLMLQTPRYKHLIYSRQHGSELHTLIGQDRDYALSEAKRMIADALSVDTRITSVRDFVYQDGVLFFVIDTIYGNANMQTEVYQ